MKQTYKYEKDILISYVTFGKRKYLGYLHLRHSDIDLAEESKLLKKTLSFGIMLRFFSHKDTFFIFQRIRCLNFDFTTKLFHISEYLKS